MIAAILILIPVAAALSLPIVWLLAGVGRRLGQVDTPGAEAHKQHAAPTPNIGGIGIYVAMGVPLALGLLGIWLLPAGTWTGFLEPVAVHLPGLRSRTPLLIALLAALTLLHIMGLVDDRRGLPASLRLLVELAVGAGLAYFFDVRILMLLDDFGALGTLASVTISAFWIALIVNAMNMLDNMDGLAAGVGTIIASLYLAATLVGQQWFVAALAALLVGSLLGFLCLNFPPARIFMGDGGSMVLGLTLAVLTVRTTYTQLDGSEEVAADVAMAPLAHGAAWYGVLMPLLLMAVPLYDLVSVSVIRMRQGRSPFAGDRQHFSHRLVMRGLTTRSAVTIIYLCTLATGLGGVMLNSLAPWQAALVAAQAGAVIALLALLEFGPGTKPVQQFPMPAPRAAEASRAAGARS